MMRPEPCAIDHAPHRLAREEEALHVRVEREVVVGLVHVLGGVLRAEPGVVDEHVDPSEGVDDGPHRPVDLGDVQDVHLDPHGAASHRGDLGFQVGPVGSVP